MKIVHVLNGVAHTGNGIANVAVDLAVEQRRRGHDVWVVSAGGGFLELLDNNSVAHHHVDFTSRTPRALARAYRQLARILDEINPEVVHAHTITPTVLGYFATRRRRAALIATVHNEYQRGVSMMRLADVVVGVSNAVSEAMVRRGVPRRKVHTVLNGTVGSPRRPPLARDDLVDLPPQSILTVGAVSHRKGADLLLAAFEHVLQDFPKAHLYYVGNVDWQHPADVARSKSWADQVHFVGFDAQPQRYFPAASVFVLASRREPLGLVLLEALEAGLPVVASDVDGIPEALDFGRAGLLVKVGDANDLAAKIKALLRLEGDRKSLAEAGARHVATLTVASMTGLYLDLYKSQSAS
ncbi:glycosyltransferase family 4 protein [Geodermatophilus sp. URMC 61]|uniref:glycosyltransferase family 4 protein n=1 Tax=Geodermatophilus sp. URMC 61 TaxID=3423411 RepID=UPI00406CEAC1